MTQIAAQFDMSEAELRQGSLLAARLIRRSLIFGGLMLAILVGIDTYFHFVHCCAHRDFSRALLSRVELVVPVAFGFFLLQRFILIPMICRKRYRQNPFFYRDATFEADEQGFRYATAKTQSKWQWSDLAGYRENEGAYLLYPSKTFAHVVPKRLFSSEDAATLKNWIESKVKRL
jgi:hypothetical protein